MSNSLSRRDAFRLAAGLSFAGVVPPSEAAATQGAAAADYHGDRTAFGVEIVAAVNSPRIKLLYD